MQQLPLLAPEREESTRRVREDVRDGVAVFCASLLLSVVATAAITLLMKLVG